MATFQPNPHDALASKAGIGTHPAKRAWHELAEAARARINGQLGAGVASAMVCAAIDALIALGDADAAVGDSRTACSKGCSYCCHMRVVLTAPEVLRIAAFVEETFSVEERVALARRVAATDEQTRGMSDEAWGRARLPCPLLVGERVQRLSGAPARLPRLQFSFGGRLPGRIRVLCGLGSPGR